jgi:hypothetical protein
VSDNAAKPRYTFGDVNGAMKDGTHVIINGGPRDEITISFNYTDTRDGVVYHVEATGFRTIKELNGKG